MSAQALRRGGRRCGGLLQVPFGLAMGGRLAQAEPRLTVIAAARLPFGFEGGFDLCLYSRNKLRARRRVVQRNEKALADRLSAFLAPHPTHLTAKVTTTAAVAMAGSSIARRCLPIVEPRKAGRSGCSHCAQSRCAHVGRDG